MSEKSGPRTTARLVVRAGVAALTASCCTIIVVNAIFLQPASFKRVVGDDANVIGENVSKPSADALVTRISVTPEDTLIARLSVEGDPLVREIQTELRRLGLYKVLPDGIDGARTRSAVIAYQRANGLSATGESSRELLDRMLFAKQLAAAATYTSSVDVLVPSENVRRVQVALSALGFDAGHADGILGDQTRQAIRAFQAYRGMPRTGDVSADLARELGITLAAEG
jgi:peptidoglycan hydrolase-like protein with peptidoglycan-binding domain